MTSYSRSSLLAVACADALMGYLASPSFVLVNLSASCLTPSVTTLVFYAQSTSTVMSGRHTHITVFESVYVLKLVEGTDFKNLKGE